jgi:K+-sensing histidine kinase KdpD
MRWIDARVMARLVAVVVPSLALATAVVAFLENILGLPNASAVYLLAVVATAIGSGTIGAVVAAIAGIGLYDYLFTHPVHTFFISDPDEWLNLVLLLFVGLVVGELTALQRSRAEIARAREREARELFRISRALDDRRAPGGRRDPRGRDGHAAGVGEPRPGRCHRAGCGGVPGGRPGGAPPFAGRAAPRGPAADARR